MKMMRARLNIHGVVQGVFYRASTVEVAKRHGVYGWVKNKPDGSVEAVLEGEEGAVEKVIGWCRIGPPRARVDNVEILREEYKDEFDDFIAVTKYSAY